MKSKMKGLISLLIALVLTVSGAVMAIGATVSEEDFEVIVTTDKSTYEAGEKIKLSFSIKNNSTDVEVTNVDLGYIIGDDLKEYIEDYDKLPKHLSTLDAGVNKVFGAKKEEINTQDKPGEGDKLGTEDKPSTEDKPVTPDVPVNPDGPKPGDNSNVNMFVGMLLVVAGIVVALKTGCGKKFVASIMVVAMLLGLNGVSLIQAKAAEDYLYVEGSTEINYAGKDREIYVLVYLTLDYEPEVAELDLTPTELAKMLLANERLDTELLDSNNKLISDGKMDTAFNNLRVMTLSTVDATGYDKYSNDIDYFNSYIYNIQTIIENTKANIDFVKEYVGAESKWIDYLGEDKEILLKVTDNAEWLLMRSDMDEYICRRYTDDNGDEVYEIYREYYDNGNYSYVLCIADKRYEYSDHTVGDTDSQDDDYDNYVVIDNSRGYWNMFTTSPVYGVEEPRYNMTNLVAGSEFAYKYDSYIYEKSNDGYKSDNHITYITPELDCDLISIYESYMDIKLVGFEGIASLETDDFHFVTSFTTTAGKVINEDDVFDGIVYEHGVIEDPTGRPYPRLEFKLKSDSDEAAPMTAESVKKILTTLDSYGITCKGEKDMEAIIASVDGSYAIADNFPNYYQWNGYYLTDKEAADNAVAAGREKHMELKAQLVEMKDAEKCENASGVINYDNYDFTDIAIKGAEAITFKNGKVTIDGLQVEVSVGDVMMEGDAYEIQYGLADITNNAGEYGSLILINTPSSGAATYSGVALDLEKSAEFNIPECTSAGVYTLVAYVATEEGIRVSKMVPVAFTGSEEYTNLVNGYQIEVGFNEDDELVVIYTLANEYWVEFVGAYDTIDYDEVYSLLLAEVYKYGYPDLTATVEVYDVQTGEVREATQNESLNGLVCRLAYEIPNMTAMTGYIYVELP